MSPTNWAFASKLPSVLTVVAVVVNAPLEEVVTDDGTAVVPVVPVNVIVLPSIPASVVESLRVPDIVTSLFGPVGGIVFIVSAVGFAVTVIPTVGEFLLFPATSKAVAKRV